MVRGSVYGVTAKVGGAGGKLRVVQRVCRDERESVPTIPSNPEPIVKWEGVAGVGR